MSLLRRLSRLTWEIIVVLVVVAVVAGMFGGSLLDVLLAALATTGVVLVTRSLPIGEAPEWPRLPAAERSGRRAEVYRLSWSMTTHGDLIDAAAVRRLRAVARDRLDLLGVDPADDAAVRALLGPPAHAVLHRTDGVSLRELSAVLDALERTNPPPAPGGATTRSPG